MADTKKKYLPANKILEKHLSSGKIATIKAHGWLNNVLKAMEDYGENHIK